MDCMDWKYKVLGISASTAYPFINILPQELIINIFQQVKMWATSGGQSKFIQSFSVAHNNSFQTSKVNLTTFSHNQFH